MLLRLWLFVALVASSSAKEENELDELLDLMELGIDPEPVEGGRWWYGPSAKPHTHRRHPSRNASSSIVKLDGKGKKLRLPGDLVPVSYNIRLLPFLEADNFTTDGHVEILFNCLKETNSITVNSVDLTFDCNSIKVWDVSTKANLTATKLIDEQLTRQMITVQTATPMLAGRQYGISIKFISILNDESRGFYQSYYKENNEKKYFAVTQFEATDARRSFPCFDEPSMKANFTLTLGRKTSMISASNMPLIKSEIIPGLPGYVWDYYETSVRMSTYFVAALVADYEVYPAEEGLSNVKFRVLARPGSAHLTKYANNVGPRMSEFFEELLDFDFPLPKQDMVAIPYFPFGAMENWGLIIYKDYWLLADLQKDTVTDILIVLTTIAHELAHQWFGDIVTMDWWNNIWLNEGFASYMEHLAIDAVEPDFHMKELILFDMHRVFVIDALETSRPIVSDAKTPDEISALFDTISYEKGACVVRMMADFLGFETFQRGLRRYMKEKSFANANQDEILQILQNQANIDGVSLPATLQEIVGSWTHKMGYPLVTVKRNYGTGDITITQERFLLRRNNQLNDTTVYRWWIPLSYTSDISRPENRTWLSKDQPSHTFPSVGISADQWVIFNVDEKNFYRVAYDVTNYGLIRDKLVSDHKGISIENRAQLFDDTFVLASLSLVHYDQALDLSLYLKFERDYVPWKSASNRFNYIHNMLFDTFAFDHWKEYLTAQVLPYFSHLGFYESPTDSYLIKLSRTDAMSWACRLEVPECVKSARDQYVAFMKQPDNSSIISVNQKSIVFKTAIANGGQDEWNFAFDLYKERKEVDFLVAMTCSKDPVVLSNLLDMILDSKSAIDPRHYTTLFHNVASNPVGNPIALEFLSSRWGDLENKRVKEEHFSAWFRLLCNLQKTEKGYEKLIELLHFHKGTADNFPKAIQQGLTVVKENIRWMQEHLDEIGAWLAAHRPSSARPQ